MEDIVTGEAVVLDLPCARFPTRLLAHLVDMLVQIPALILVAILTLIAVADRYIDGASSAAVFVSGYVLILVGYPAAFETLSRGRTLGKMALGLRVVGDDGGPERFRQALVRALAGAIECWALVGVPALVASLFSSRGKRLGDMFAGTFVIRERAPRATTPAMGVPLAGLPLGGVAAGGALPGGGEPGGSVAGGSVAGFPDPAIAAWAATLDLSGLPEQLAASAASYLSRYWQLHQPARDQLGWRLAGDIATRVAPPPPPGMPPVIYLTAVLTERRNREFARLSRLTPAAPAQPGGAPARGDTAATQPGGAPGVSTPIASASPDEPASGGFVAPQ